MGAGIPAIAIDGCCPPAIVRDLQRLVDSLRAKGSTHLLIQIPAEDFAASIDAVVKQVCYPFTPMLCGCPCAPWEKDHLGVMHRADPTQMTPNIITPTGREEAIDP
jgi:hypothetical protein